MKIYLNDAGEIQFLDGDHINRNSLNRKTLIVTPETALATRESLWVQFGDNRNFEDVNANILEPIRLSEEKDGYKTIFPDELVKQAGIWYMTLAVRMYSADGATFSEQLTSDKVSFTVNDSYPMDDNGYISNGTLENAWQQIQNAVQDAEGSANESAESASAAAKSAEEAKQSASSAEQSEDIATGAATQALASEKRAAESAEAAAGSAREAAESASNAGGAAGTAERWANEAAGSATAAAGSATASAASASQANNSAIAAANSAKEAADSAQEIKDMQTTFALRTEAAGDLTVTINPSDFVITFTLKSVDGEVIRTQTVDLPLESVVVGGRYDEASKSIVLTLQNGETVDIPVGDLVEGLASQDALDKVVNGTTPVAKATEADTAGKVSHGLTITIDGVPTVFDGSGAKSVTINTSSTTDAEAVHFTEQTLNEEQREQARKNIGAGVPKNLLYNGDFRLNTQGKSSYPSGEPYGTDEFVDGWNMIESASRTGTVEVISGGGVKVTATAVSFGIRQRFQTPMAGKTVTGTIKVSNVTGGSKLYLYLWNAAYNTHSNSVAIPSEGTYRVTYTIPSEETNNFEFYIAYAASGWVGESSCVIEWVKLEEGSVSTAPYGLVEDATRALYSEKAGTAESAEALSRTAELNTSGSNAVGWYKLGEITASGLAEISAGNNNYSAIFLVNGNGYAGLNNAMPSGIIEIDGRIESNAFVANYARIKILAGNLDAQSFCVICAGEKQEIYYSFSNQYERTFFTVLSETYGSSVVNAFAFGGTYYGSAAPSGATYAINRIYADTAATAARLSDYYEYNMRSSQLGWYKIAEITKEAITGTPDGSVVALHSTLLFEYDYAQSDIGGVTGKIASGIFELDARYQAGAFTQTQSGIRLMTGKIPTERFVTLFTESGDMEIYYNHVGDIEIFRITRISEFVEKGDSKTIGFMQEYIGASIPAGTQKECVDNRIAKYDAEGNDIPETYATKKAVMLTGTPDLNDCVPEEVGEETTWYTNAASVTESTLNKPTGASGTFRLSAIRTWENSQNPTEQYRCIQTFQDTQSRVWVRAIDRGGSASADWKPWTELAGGSGGSNPNLLINPDFRINQRGADTYRGTGVDKIYCVDRWTIGNLKVDVLDNCIEISRSSAGEREELFTQYFEKHLELNQTYTLSLAVSDTETGSIRILSGTGRVPSQLEGMRFISIDIDPNSSLVKAAALGYNSYSDSFYVTIGMTGITNLYVHWIKLEKGDSATPFTPPDPAIELLKCQRYYLKYTNRFRLGCIYNGTKNYGYSQLLFPVKMRKAPTVSCSFSRILNSESTTIEGDVSQTTEEGCVLFTSDSWAGYQTFYCTSFEADAEI